MTDPLYTERDLVLKGPTVERVLADCSMLELGVQQSKLRSELVKSLDRAKYEGRPVVCEDLKLTAAWDETRKEYCAVLKGFYDPSNLVSILYERLTTLNSEVENTDDLVDRYLGVIEEKEKVSLLDARQKLKILAKELRETLSLYQEEEFSEQDLEKLSTILDTTYFDPISELLEGVLVTIAGN